MGTVKPVAPTKPWHGKRVLVVDDAASQRTFNAGIYERIGMEVIDFATNGREAIEKYHKLQPDLVSMDIIMPEMHGIDCYRQLINQNCRAKFIFVTCLLGEKLLAERFQEEVPHTYSSKTLETESLLARLDAIYADKKD